MLLAVKADLSGRHSFYSGCLTEAGDFGFILAGVRYLCAGNKSQIAGSSVPSTQEQNPSSPRSRTSS
jgi:hypothetical protein